MTVGKPHEKWLNEKDASDGWKVHRVTGVDMERNTITLDGVTVSLTSLLDVMSTGSQHFVFRSANARTESCRDLKTMTCWEKTKRRTTIIKATF